jgi:hypothetical protein
MVALVLSGCGSSRQLQSVSLGPSSADAKNFANGQVSFSAMGTYTKPPSPTPLTSSDVFWCIGDSSGMCNGNIVTGASIDSSGLAQCIAPFSGTVTILAGTSSVPSLPDGGRQLKIFGSAQLTCP